MPPEPVPADPGWDEDPAWLDRDPVTPAEREAWLDRVAGAGEPPEEEDPGDWEPLTAGELAEIREFAAADARVWAGMAGRRGPGQPGSARIYPGESASGAAAFGSGLALDVMPACPGLALSADAAAGEDDSYAGVSDDELLGVLAAWDRLEAHMAPASTDTPSGTAAPDPNPAATPNAPDPRHPGSPSPRPAETARPAGTAPGYCAPPATARTCGSPSTPSTPGRATTATDPQGTTPGSSSGT
jgi:hypothetical protein